MARRVFFSFHYTNDSWRVSQIRNSWVCKPEGDAQPFLDKAEWEQIKRKGKQAIKDWIDEQMKGCGVTCVLIGEQTSQRPWVKYEIEKSHNEGRGLFGIYIDGMLDQSKARGLKGVNPFDNFYIERNGKEVLLSEIYPVYHWINDNGRENISKWIEKAAKAAGR
ncbi:TIR domain-containing protein [Rufibacter latericius]|uniref:TIR-like domain-containing protein n=1 Tax=Rufibacter latericius TaxID=2487040 RepID=A0A3M9MFR9_9BACT|nr:TIR domain-containing protein [Rufibacter latericius]RNI24035.1 TIR-like domain-containing protein [Rufibacter latericius]